jgi:parallel beta-helix repeat protein
MKANLKPGDTVIVRSGTYNEAVVVNKDGAAGKYITIRSEVPGGAKIDPPGDKHGVHINANYVKFDGFEVKNSKGAGITAVGAHHVEVTDNIVHNNVANGIFFGKSDFILIEGNVVYDNAAKGSTSGIHLKGMYNVTGDKSTNGFRIIIRDNVAFGNETKFGPKTDGNGISLDDFQNTQVRSLPPYRFKTLVEDNIVYSNSGRGIQVAWSDYATIRDNVSIHNNADGRTGVWLSELVNMGSHNNTWTGNIAVTDKGNPAIANVSFQGDGNNKGVSWYSNTTFNGKNGDSSTYANAGNSLPTKANGNKLGNDPGLTLSKVQQMADLDHLPDTTSSASTTTLAATEKLSVAALELPVTVASAALTGTAANDKLVGTAGNDSLIGASGKDFLNGGDGSDIIVGGNGVDTLAGGDGDDVFVYRHASNATTGDVIADFSDGDIIDLSGIDASTKSSGNQTFEFIGSKGFSGKEGELQYKKGIVAGDVNGDKAADFHIEIANHHGLAAGDFIF